MVYSLKLECEKLASEKIEIQRHYVMVSLSSSFSFVCFIVLPLTALQNSCFQHLLFPFAIISSPFHTM